MASMMSGGGEDSWMGHQYTQCTETQYVGVLHSNFSYEDGFFQRMIGEVFENMKRKFFGQIFP